jgi:hypothetical protein
MYDPVCVLYRLIIAYKMLNIRFVNVFSEF